MSSKLLHDLVYESPEHDVQQRASSIQGREHQCLQAVLSRKAESLKHTSFGHAGRGVRRIMDACTIKKLNHDIEYVMQSCFSRISRINLMY